MEHSNTVSHYNVAFAITVLWVGHSANMSIPIWVSVSMNSKHFYFDASMVLVAWVSFIIFLNLLSFCLI